MKTPVQRLLSPIADVRRNEVASALLMTLLVFLLLAAYYLLKTVREVLILTEGGAEVKSYSSAGQAVLFLFLVPAYGAFASRVPRVKLVTTVTLFFASHVVLFMLAIAAGLHVGVVYFLWAGIFNVMVIAQFWAFANDTYTEEQGRRLFPLIGVGASLGAWLGAVRAGTLIEGSSPSRLLAGATGILIISAALVPLIHRLSSARERASDAASSTDTPLAREGGFEMIRRDRYLLFIAAMMLLVNVVNTTGEYLFGRYIVEQANTVFAGTDPAAVAARERFVGETYSRLYSNVNLIGFLLQMFAVSRIVKWFGVGPALLLHPLTALVGYLLLLRAPSLPLLTTVKIADNSLDYSLGNTTRQVLWLPTSRAAKYKAKQAVDSFFVRVGDVASAGLVFAGERLALGVPAFAAVIVVLTLVWVGVVMALTSLRAHRVAEMEGHAAHPSATHSQASADPGSSRPAESA
jgi:AAA family ATP:ADP antiporter